MSDTNIITIHEQGREERLQWRVTLRNRKYLRIYTPHIARTPLIYSPSVIPMATTGPKAPIQLAAPIASTPPQPVWDGPASTTTGPTIPMPTTPAMPDTGRELGGYFLTTTRYPIRAPNPHPTFSELSATPL